MPLIDLYDRIKAGLVVVNNRSPLPMRFWKNVNKDGPEHPTLGRCWQWIGSLFMKHGYGQIMVERKFCKASRVAWKLLVGEIPDGLWVLHKCDNRACVNPKHLYLGTSADNARDRQERRGDKRHLSMEDVQEIRRLYVPAKPMAGKGPGLFGGNSSQLAEKFNTTPQVIRGIVAGRTYIHIK